MCITILSKRYKLSIPSLSLNNADLVYTSSIIHLSVVLNKNVKDDGDISRQLRCLYASSDTSLRKFAYCTQNVKVHLLESYYLKFKFLLFWTIVWLLHVEYIQIEGMRKTHLTFHQRLLSSTNNIVTCINTNTRLWHNYMWQKWDNCLYICHNYWMFHIILTNVCATVI